MATSKVTPIKRAADGEKRLREVHAKLDALRPEFVCAASILAHETWSTGNVKGDEAGCAVSVLEEAVDKLNDCLSELYDVVGRVEKEVAHG